MPQTGDEQELSGGRHLAELSGVSRRPIANLVIQAFCCRAMPAAAETRQPALAQPRPPGVTRLAGQIFLNRPAAWPSPLRSIGQARSPFAALGSPSSALSTFPSLPHQN